MLPKSFIDEMIRGGGDRLIAGDDKTLRIPAGSFSQAAHIIASEGLHLFLFEDLGEERHLT